MNVIDLAVAVSRVLDAAGLPHAFGGALALNLYAEPRMTMDVDVSVFVPWEQRGQVLPLFEEIGFCAEPATTPAMPVAGIRLRSDVHREHLDVFFALDPVYDRVRDRSVMVAYGLNGERLPFFTAEDIVLFKLSFNRPKDWVDIQSVIRNGPVLDDRYIEQVLTEMRGPTMYPRVARLRAMIASGGDLG